MNSTVRLPEQPNGRKLIKEGKRAALSQLLVARVFIGIVLFFNVQCALVFIGMPGSYIQSFNLQGASGILLVQALGILFLMWNVPYVVALIDPQKHRLSLVEAIIMQAIGLIGETSLLILSPASVGNLRNSLIRFILFDSLGLLCLFLGAWASRKK